MDQDQTLSGATSPWKHALAFDSAVGRRTRGWDRVEKKSFARKGRKVWKRPESKDKESKDDATRGEEQNGAVVVNGSKRQRLKQVPVVPKQSSTLNRYAPVTNNEAPETPKRKSEKRQSLRTGLLKRAVQMANLGTSPVKQKSPSPTKQSVRSPLKRSRRSFAGIEEPVFTSPKKAMEREADSGMDPTKDSEIVVDNVFTESIPINSPQAVVLVPLSTRYSLDSIDDHKQTEKMDENGVEIDAPLEETTHQETAHTNIVGKIDAKSQQSPQALPTKLSTQPLSTPRRANRRLSKRQSDIGPKRIGKPALSPNKRRSFGMGQSYKFNMNNLPTLEELKADEKKMRLTTQDIDTEEGVTTAALKDHTTPEEPSPQDSETLSDETVVTNDELRSEDMQQEHVDNTVNTNDKIFTSKEEMGESVLSADKFKETIEQNQETQESVANSPRPVSILRNSLSPRKKTSINTRVYEDDDRCVDLDMPLGVASDDISEDELIMSPGTPLQDDDATVPVLSPAYRANTAGSPPPEVTARANSLEDNSLEDDQMTLEITTDVTADIESPEDESTCTGIEPLQEAPQEIAPKRTRSGARFSDDTSILKEFLNRAHARKAAQAMQAPEPAPTTVSPRRSPRKVLGHLDNNSPSPTKCRSNGAGATPVKAVISLPSEDTDDTLTLDPMAESTPLKTRRSGRSKPTNILPSKQQQTVTPAPVTSFIPVRRTDGQEPVVLQRSLAQELASTTRTNTRRNKGAAKMPKVMLETTLKEPPNSPIKQRSPSKRTNKGVNWDRKLVYYQEDVEEEKQKKQKTSIKRQRVQLNAGSAATPSSSVNSGGTSSVNIGKNAGTRSNNSSKRSAGSTPRVKRVGSSTLSTGVPGHVALEVGTSVIANGTPAPAPKRRGRSRV